MVNHGGDRPTGIGMLSDGSIDIGIGRKNSWDDDKGLPDGVTDKDPWHIGFSISVFKDSNEAKVNTN
jgi:hypothetical protein